MNMARNWPTQVADQLIYTSIRTDQDTQRLSIPTRIGVRHPKLSQVIRMMEANIEEPISPATLASDVGMSTRQLERLFRRYVNRSPQTLLHGAAPVESAQPVDADRHERDQRGAGLRLHLTLAFLEMLPGALQHDAIPRTRRPSCGCDALTWLPPVDSNHDFLSQSEASYP